MSGEITWEDLAGLNQQDLANLKRLRGLGPASYLPTATLDPQKIATWLGAKSADESMQAIAQAVTRYVNSLPSIDLVEGVWAETTMLGATMLGARLYKRRNSPNGIEAFAEVGNTYISRYDSDIARLLHVEAFRKPMIG